MLNPRRNLKDLSNYLIDNYNYNYNDELTYHYDNNEDMELWLYLGDQGDFNKLVGDIITTDDFHSILKKGVNTLVFYNK